jgi:hypothetical protein
MAESAYDEKPVLIRGLEMASGSRSNGSADSVVRPALACS